jgi:hypothetical protein
MIILKIKSHIQEYMPKHPIIIQCILILLILVVFFGLNDNVETLISFSGTESTYPINVNTISINY